VEDRCEIFWASDGDDLANPTNGMQGVMATLGQSPGQNLKNHNHMNDK
jgi:hypothetical protein